jgi:hypothetical protein
VTKCLHISVQSDMKSLRSLFSVSPFLVLFAHIYNYFNDTVNKSNYIKTNDLLRVNNELEGTWKETVWSNLR